MRVFSRKGITILNKNEGERVLSIQFRTGFFFDSTWYKFGENLPEVNDLSWGDYSDRKRHSFDDFLESIESEIVQLKQKQQPVQDITESTKRYLSLTDARKVLKLSKEKYIELIKDKQLSGKKIGSRWFVTSESITKLGESE